MYDNYAKIRDSKGLKDYNVAKGTGISPGTFGDWKAGNYTPKVDKLQKIADFLGVSLEYLQTGKDSAKESVSGKKYYFDDATAEMAQELYQNSEMRVLFDAQRDMEPEDMKAVYNMVLALKRKERGTHE